VIFRRTISITLSPRSSRSTYEVASPARTNRLSSASEKPRAQDGSATAVWVLGEDGEGTTAVGVEADRHRERSFTAWKKAPLKRGQ
jgi:hypothetical protein